MIKIKTTSKMEAFFERCKQNMISINDVSGVKLNSNSEKILLKELQKHDKSIKSVYYNENLILDNPYYKNINLKNIKTSKIEYKNITLRKNEAMDISWKIPDKNKEFDDYSIFGAVKKNISIPVLKEAEDVWMSPTLAEQNTINPFVDKATGNVLTFGLGIGYYPYMCSLKEDVSSVTIIEINKDIIELFEEYILPQFEFKDKIKVIHGDMYDYFNEEFLDKFNYTFVDVWKDNEHGFNMLDKLFEQLNYKGNIDYWIEFSCYTAYRMLLFLYLQRLASGSLTELLMDFADNPENNRILKKIHKYFRGKDIEITEVSTIKDILYNITTLREILSVKL